MENTTKSPDPKTKDIESREDIERLVHTFYGKIRKHGLLGPIFNRHIPTEEDWVHHLAKLSDFWQSNLIGPQVFKGNPIVVHQEVNRQEGGVIGMGYFLKWLEQWDATVRELFDGPVAELARKRAILMARHLQMRINDKH